MRVAITGTEGEIAYSWAKLGEALETLQNLGRDAIAKIKARHAADAAKAQRAGGVRLLRWAE